MNTEFSSSHNESYPSPLANQPVVLIIDDDRNMRDIFTILGQQDGYTMQFAENGIDGIRIAEHEDIDLVILDLTMPGLTGFEVCRKLRSAGIDTPIIMLSARSDPVDVVVGLEIGADDYVTKPFEIRELAARVNAKLRRQRSLEVQVRPGRLKFPGLTIDLSHHEVLREGQPVNLTPTEFDILVLISSSPGRVISRTEMIQQVWGSEADLDLRSVDAHVYRLRRKIEPGGKKPTYIHAVPGIGYRFERRGLNERLYDQSDDADGRE